MSEFNLSEERVFYPEGFFYPAENIKEFIRLLKEETMHNAPNSLISVHDIIDKLAGDTLKGTRKLI